MNGLKASNSNNRAKNESGYEVTIDETFDSLTTTERRRAALKSIMVTMARGPQTIGHAAIGRALIDGVRESRSIESEADIEVLRELVREARDMAHDPKTPERNKSGLLKKALTSAEKLAMSSGGRRG